MEDLSLVIRTANRDRKAEIGVHPETTVGEILQEAMDNWALPANYEYIIRCERLERQLQPTMTLRGAGIQANDVLEVQQISDAGHYGRV